MEEVTSIKPESLRRILKKTRISPLDNETYSSIIQKWHNDFNELLSIREVEVLYLLSQGAVPKDVAVFLQITHRTVKYHKTNIFKKLCVKTTTQAVILAVRKFA